MMLSFNNNVRKECHAAGKTSILNSLGEVQTACRGLTEPPKLASELVTINGLQIAERLVCVNRSSASDHSAKVRKRPTTLLQLRKVSARCGMPECRSWALYVGSQGQNSGVSVQSDNHMV